MSSPSARSGLDVLVEDGFAALRDQRVGLVTNQAGVDSQFRHAAELLAAAPDVQLAALFGPEHGLGGEAQDLVGVNHDRHPLYGCPVHSLYGDSLASLRPRPEALEGLHSLLIDLPDIGSRYYTFQATMLYCLEAAADANVTVLILDRPNPLDGVTIEGPTIEPGYESFVGAHPIPTRHGMSLGELARLYVAERGIRVHLQVVPCRGWRREQYLDETGLPWVLPSPNMPTLDTAIVYPGQCLLEGTNLSEGRGTTRPFELCGAPWIDPHKLVRSLAGHRLPGVVFRPATFRPTFQKHAGHICGGVQLHVMDRTAFRSVRTSLALLAALRAVDPSEFRWRTEVYEFVDDKPAIDLLFGGSRERLAIEAGTRAEDIAATWVETETAFRTRRESHLLY